MITLNGEVVATSNKRELLGPIDAKAYWKTLEEQPKICRKMTDADRAHMETLIKRAKDKWGDRPFARRGAI